MVRKIYSSSNFIKRKLTQNLSGVYRNTIVHIKIRDHGSGLLKSILRLSVSTKLSVGLHLDYYMLKLRMVDFCPNFRQQYPRPPHLRINFPASVNSKNYMDADNLLEKCHFLPILRMTMFQFHLEHKDI